jgi:hypothetical protein
LHALASGRLKSAHSGADSSAVDIFDLFATLDVPGTRPRDRRETAAAAIGALAFPLLDFAIVLFAGAYTRPVLALVVLPVLFTAASAMVCRLLQLSGAATLRTTLACVVMCFLASAAGFLLGVISSFYSGF